MLQQLMVELSSSSCACTIVLRGVKQGLLKRLLSGLLLLKLHSPMTTRITPGSQETWDPVAANLKLNPIQWPFLLICSFLDGPSACLNCIRIISSAHAS